MAAHIVTGLLSVIELRNQEQIRNEMQAALALSCWTEDLDLDEWCKLNALVERNWMSEFHLEAIRILGKYIPIWQELLEPKTREEWHHSKLHPFAITGVAHQNQLDIDWLAVEDTNGIDMGCRTCDTAFEVYGEHVTDDEQQEICENCYRDEWNKHIGSWKEEKGELVIDDTGEYSAIHTSFCGGTIQVLWSRYTTRTRLCSPCFPDQGDLGNDGEHLTFDLPEEAYAEEGR